MPVCFGLSFTKSHLNQGNALVYVYTDGSVSVTTGGIEMGQGVSSNVAAVVARTFGSARRRVRVESTTTRVANMSPTAARATTDLNGNAAIIAVETILEGMREVVATELGAAAPATVTIADEQVHAAGKPAGMNWTDLVGASPTGRAGASRRTATTPRQGIHYDEARERGHPFAYHVYGTAVFEVTVDCLRGTYAVDQVKIVHDLGRTINPTVDRGQVEGGLAQGMGWMTMETCSGTRTAAACPTPCQPTRLPMSTSCPTPWR